MLLKRGEIFSFKDIHDLIFAYMLKITLNSFPFIPFLSSLFHNPTRQILSKAAEKSMCEQNSFFFCDLRVSVRNIRVKMWSVVENQDLKPASFCLRISNLLKKEFMRSFNMAVNIFPRQLNIVIRR
jgi:hypothetical protein